MFGHLKAEDFVNLMEGLAPVAKHKAHLDDCPQCQATWQSLKSVHTEVSSLNMEIPEPDWTEFRSSVRDQLLSRSIQRESTVRRWTGWAIRPAAAWALSVVLAVGVTAVTLLWNVEHRTPAVSPGATIDYSPVLDPAAEVIVEAGPERALFDDVLSLGEEQQEQLRELLESTDPDQYRQ